MTNDIKEILEKPNVYSFNDECYLYFGDYNKLKNYITNLQEENSELKELADKYEEEHNTTFNYWKQLIKEDYKSRCEKAIKYINSTGYGTDFSMNAEEVDVLFNILKGE